METILRILFTIFWGISAAVLFYFINENDCSYLILSLVSTIVAIIALLSINEKKVILAQVSSALLLIYSLLYTGTFLFFMYLGDASDLEKCGGLIVNILMLIISSKSFLKSFSKRSYAPEIIHFKKIVQIKCMNFKINIIDFFSIINWIGNSIIFFAVFSFYLPLAITISVIFLTIGILNVVSRNHKIIYITSSILIFYSILLILLLLLAFSMSNKNPLQAFALIPVILNFYFAIRTFIIEYKSRQYETFI